MMKDDNQRSPRPRVVILTPAYNEEQSLPLYERAVREVLFSQTDYDFRVLFIEDGSTDRSWKVISKICANDSRFSGIRLSRNFGSHVALSAGFVNAEGDAIAILACDLQDPPEVVLEFLAKWRAGARIVWGRRRKREDKRWRIVTSNIFFKLIQRFAMPRGSKFTTGSFCLVDRQVADCFKQFQERNRTVFALVAWTGFDQEIVDYDRKERLAGNSGWNFGKMITATYDTFIGFSFLPIRLITILGAFVSFLTLPIAIYLLSSWFTGQPLMGWTSLMLAVVLFFGIQFLLMGIVGEYLYRIYAESVRRPLFFISDKVGLDR
ncbi:MAG: glycosyltransferase family 2 protein [Desulfobaccales bacterium]